MKVAADISLCTVGCQQFQAAYIDGHGRRSSEAKQPKKRLHAECHPARNGTWYQAKEVHHTGDIAILASPRKYEELLSTDKKWRLRSTLRISRSLLSDRRSGDKVANA
eukprot:6206227-Pleurochrysis_carterae.AAC.1